MNRELEQIRTMEAIDRIEQRIYRLRTTPQPGPTQQEYAEAILLSLCDVLRGGFTR